MGSAEATRDHPPSSLASTGDDESVPESLGPASAFGAWQVVIPGTVVPPKESGWQVWPVGHSFEEAHRSYAPAGHGAAAHAALRLAPPKVAQQTWPVEQVDELVQLTAAPEQVAVLAMQDEPAAVMQQVCPVLQPEVGVHPGAASIGVDESVVGPGPPSVPGCGFVPESFPAGGLFDVVDPLHATITALVKIVLTASVLKSFMGKSPTKRFGRWFIREGSRLAPSRERNSVSGSADFVEKLRADCAVAGQSTPSPSPRAA